jgi:hypothetical protein
MTSDEILAQVLDLLQREGGWPIGRLSAGLTSMTMTCMN